MIAKSPIEKAAAMVEDVSYAVSDLVEIEGQILMLMKSRRELFKIEQVAKKRITDEINGLKTKKKEIQLLLRRDYPVFSIECLSWRDRNGYPLLAVFELEKAKFSLSVRRHAWRNLWHENVMSPHIAPVRRCYDDVFDLLTEKAKEEKKSLHLRTEFAGVIPQDVRDEIVVMRDSFESVYVIAEVEEWDLKRSAPIRQGDPLVIGYEGGKFFLIAAFDTTPLEAYLEALSIKGKKEEPDE